MHLQFKRLSMVGASTALLLASQGVGLAHAQASPQTLIVGVDHADMANQRPDQGRIFEYTDFFSREATIHSGDTVDFRFAPGSFHIVALAAREDTARTVYPLALIDTDDNHVAAGTGLPKLALGPANGPIVGGSVSGGGTIGGPNDLTSCGLTVAGQKPCTFTSASDIENSGGVAGVDPSSGQLMPVDWMMQVSAGPGDYEFFCYIHPGMRGKLHVVASGQPASSQADVDSLSAQQFQADQSAALAAEQQFNVDKATTNPSNGAVSHHVSVGIAAADNHIAIDEMLPQKISVNLGDEVEFKWRDGHNVHTVGIAQAESQLPQPFVFDCGTSTISPPNPNGPPAGGFCMESGRTNLETIGDPGNALSGTVLKNVQSIVNSGFLAGGDFGVQPTTQTWSVRTDKKTQPGGYNYWCSVHDWMHGTMAIGQ